MAARAAAAMGAVARAARKVVEGVAVSVAPGAARVETEVAAVVFWAAASSVVRAVALSRPS